MVAIPDLEKNKLRLPAFPKLVLDCCAAYMSFNLPSSRILRVTQGDWANVKYPTRMTVEAVLQPRDYFEPVARDDARSCVPTGSSGFSFVFDSNSGKVTLRGPDMLQSLEVRYLVEETWDAVFTGRCMQVSQVIDNEASIDAVLTHVEYTLPSLLSIATGLAVFPETIEVGFGDECQLLQARVEISFPPFDVRVVEPDERLSELQKGIEIFGVARRSSRYTLAASYLRDAMFCVASYHVHNPYTQSLIAILKCSQAIEILFSGERETIRASCRELKIQEDVIESQIVSIVVARNTLGSAHASSFMPSSDEVEIIRRFALRSVHTVRELLLHIDAASNEERNGIFGNIQPNKNKPKLIARLKDSLAVKPWTVDGQTPRQVDIMNDPRMFPDGHELSSKVLYKIRLND